MPDISKIITLNGTEYNIKDAVAREMAGGIIHLVSGVCSTELEDGASTNPITIDGESYTATSGDAVFYGSKEFVFDGSIWHEFGDMTGLGDLAMKDSASGSYTPEGTVSQPTFTGTQGTVTVSGTPTGTIEIGSGTANYTPAGTVSTPTITVTPTTDNTGYVAASATGGGSVTAGTAASATMPTLTTTVENETLTISWTAGSFTTNTPTAVTLPSFSQQTVVTGITSATSTQPTFTGTGVDLEFSGSNLSVTGNFTPEGTVSQPTFTGTAKTVTVS